jgi:AcrR family transcriptional regulator
VTTPTRPTARQRLLAAAADLFYRHGIGPVGVDLVSKQAGVSKRALYQQFGSKGRLIAESLDAHGAAIIGQYLPAEDPAAPARQQILALFDGLSGWTASETFRGCPFINTATELAGPGHPARQMTGDAGGYPAGHAILIIQRLDLSQAEGSDCDLWVFGA